MRAHELHSNISTMVHNQSDIGFQFHKYFGTLHGNPPQSSPTRNHSKDFYQTVDSGFLEVGFRPGFFSSQGRIQI